MTNCDDDFCKQLQTICDILDSKTGKLGEVRDGLKLVYSNNPADLSDKYAKEILLFGKDHYSNIINKKYNLIFESSPKKNFVKISEHIKEAHNLCSEKEKEVLWKEIIKLIKLSIICEEKKNK